MTDDQKDSLCRPIFIYIFAHSRKSHKIQIRNFNPDNKEHLFFFNQVMNCSNSFNLPIYIYMPILKFIIFKYKNHYAIRHLRKPTGCNIDCQFCLDKIKEIAAEKGIKWEC